MVFGSFLLICTQLLIINKHYNLLHYLLVSVLSKSTFQFCEEHYDSLALNFFVMNCKTYEMFARLVSSLNELLLAILGNAFTILEPKNLMNNNYNNNRQLHAWGHFSSMAIQHLVHCPFSLRIRAKCSYVNTYQIGPL
jgi:hypothetical protein